MWLSDPRSIFASSLLILGIVSFVSELSRVSVVYEREKERSIKVRREKRGKNVEKCPGSDVVDLCRDPSAWSRIYLTVMSLNSQHASSVKSNRPVCWSLWLVCSLKFLLCVEFYFSSGDWKKKHKNYFSYIKKSLREMVDMKIIFEKSTKLNVFLKVQKVYDFLCIHTAGSVAVCILVPK